MSRRRCAFRRWRPSGTRRRPVVDGWRPRSWPGCATAAARAAIAAELGVHPQTVRYRLGRLRALFGNALEDPERRFALELALRAPAPAGYATGAGTEAGGTPGL